MKKQVFYISKQFFSIDEVLDVDIPKTIKRRLSKLDRMVYTALKNVYTSNIKEIIFASKNAEFCRLEKIIEEYKEFNEVSPADFSGSLINYPVGAFCFENKLNTPYTAISAGDETISKGLMKTLISGVFPIIFCYGDEFESKKVLACNFSKIEGEIKLEAEFKGQKTNEDEFGAFLNFLSLKTPVFEAEGIKIKRL